MNNRKFRVSLMALALAALMLLSSVAIPTPASAASSKEIRQQIKELKEEKKEIAAQIKEVQDKYDANADEIQAMVNQKDAIDEEIGLLHEQVSNINAQLSAYSLLIADLQTDLDNAKTRLDELNTKNKERIRAMEEEGSLSYWSVLFKASSFSDLLDRLNMIEEIAEADRRRLEEMDLAAKAVETARQELESEKAELEDTKAALNDLQAELEVKRLAADEVLAELHKQGEALDELMAEAEARDEALQKEIAEAERAKSKEQQRLEEEERKRQEEERKKQEALQNQNKPNSSGNSTSGAAPSSAYWMIPCSYVYLSSPFGYRVHPIHGTYGFHSGVDLASPAGTPIKATRAGTVTKTAYDSGSGYYVTINHGDGFSSSYLHMTHWDPSIYVGKKVSQGEVIGYVGSTGWSTGNHLHFSIYFNGVAQNPAAYMKF